MIVGMDFGTTNSGMAVFDGTAVQVLPLDPSSANPRVLRTALYISNEQAVVIGRAAIDRYYAQNIGRVVKTRKVWIGEIEVYAEELYYVTDAYAWVDVSEPGRLLLSIKTRLREEDHPGAIIGQYFYTLEDLIALYLTVTRVRAEQLLGREIRQVVLGRPVHFSLDETHDRLAQGRLLQAAFRAGYETVFLEKEPIAAAYSYETTIDRPQNVLVFDFGGGTLDITVMRIGDPRQRRVLATGGVPIAGDVFDQKVTRVKLPPHFGEGSFYGPRERPLAMPAWIFDAFSSWQTIIELQSMENKRVLNDIARTAQRRHQIEALLSLVSSNYGLKMFDEVEQAKRVLSTRRGAEIRLEGPGFKVLDFVTRGEFEGIIRAEINTIESELTRTLQASGLQPGQVDAVIRTGGSAQIPAFYEMLCRHFGADKVQSIDAFSSVTAGLGIIAHGIEQGEISARAYTPADVAPPPQARGSRTQINRANLELLRKRILMDEGALTTAETTAEQVLVALDGGLQAVGWPPEAAGFLDLAQRGITSVPSAAVVAGPDEPLLLLTSTYRFLLTTPRELLELQSMDMQIGDLHKLAPRERICTLASWQAIRETERLLIVTSLGYARAYPLNVLRAGIEAPLPLQFDHPLPGLPVATLGAALDQQFVVVTGSGRGWRWPVSQLSVRGTQAINCGKDDRVVAAALAYAEEELLLLTEDGYGRGLLAEWVPEPPKANQHGRSLIARRSPVIGIGALPLRVVTREPAVVVLDTAVAPDPSTRSERLQQLVGRTAVCLS